MNAILRAQLLEIQGQIAALRRFYADVRAARAAVSLSWAAA
jgi:hypothetical protein